MNFKYGNSNYNLFQNNYINSNNNYMNNLNLNQNIGFNNFNNNPLSIMLQYMNLLNSTNINYNKTNQNNVNNNNNNNYISYNSTNIFQLMPNIIKFGFNQPYTFENTKKESTIIHPSNFKNKLYYKNKETSSNYNNDIINDNDSNERKFMRKMTKAEKIEIDKWFEARKKLYPTKKNIELKQKLGEIKVEKGLVSNLELKLRKKVNILKKLNSSKRIKIRNKFNKEFPNFQKRKREKLYNKEKDKDKEEDKGEGEFKEINEKENNISNNDNILEDGEIKDDYISNNENKKENNENIHNLIGKKRERKTNFKKKLGKNQNKDNKNENGFKKGFKYKMNNLYDELIRKDKIKEQNILLQAIRYLINLKEE